MQLSHYTISFLNQILPQSGFLNYSSAVLPILPSETSKVSAHQNTRTLALVDYLRKDVSINKGNTFI